MTEILRTIGFFRPKLELLRLVVKGRRRQKALRERRSVDNRLEDRAWLAMGIDHPIELAGCVIASADHRENFSSMRIDCNQGGVGARIPYSIGADFIELCQVIFHGLVRCLLKVRIEGSLDSQVWPVRFIDPMNVQLASKIIDKMRRGEFIELNRRLKR